jgi:ABC-type amino acid transport substrate-binding protein
MTNRRSFITSVAGCRCQRHSECLRPGRRCDRLDRTDLARVQRTKTLRIGAVRGAAPYYNKDLASGEWGGFMIDFAKSLAASLNVKLDITETTWGNSVLDPDPQDRPVLRHEPDPGTPRGDRLHRTAVPMPSPWSPRRNSRPGPT